MNILLAAGFVLCWSSGFIGAKLGTGAASAVTILTWRFIPLAVVLLAAAAARRAWRGLTARELARQALIGALSQSGYLLTVYEAIRLGVSSGTTALIDGTQPLIVAVLSGPLLGRSVARRQWLGLCLGVTGVAIVTAADATARTGVVWWAYLVPFVGMLSLVTATFVQGRSRAEVSPEVSLTVHCTVSALLFTTLALSTGVVVPPATPAFWGAVGWLVALPTFGGYGLYWVVLRRSGVTEVNTLMFLIAPVTAVWGALMFGEPFGVRTAIGLATALAAVVVVRAERTRAAAPRCATAPSRGRA
ncbi:DMT family transporter [Actinoallomurus sp. CA-150999]|uniref:DMT family transporter n=1 Tax=Actinoallomurus sp. CA-150999 TaxID=3239887 RepID=UPI003D8E9623